MQGFSGAISMNVKRLLYEVSNDTNRVKSTCFVIGDVALGQEKIIVFHEL